MILSALTVLPMVLMGAADAKELAVKWRASAAHLSVQTSTSVILAPGAKPVQLKGTFKQSPGLKQRYEVFDQGRSYGQVQNGDRVTSWDGDGRRYAEYSGINLLAGPTPSAPSLVTYTFPAVLTDPAMSEIKSAEWKVSGSDLTRAGESQMGKFSFRLTIGPKGEPIRLNLKVEGEISYEFTTLFSGHSTQPIPDSAFSLRPFLGWTPLFVPEPRLSLEVGSKAPTQRFRDGLTGRDFKVSDGQLGKGAVVAFVDPECPASSRLVNRLPQLREALRKKELSLKVVSLGSARPSQWAAAAAWDQTGQMERAFRVASTPSFFSLDRKGVVAGAWLGYVPGEEGKIATVLAPREEGQG